MQEGLVAEAERGTLDAATAPASSLERLGLLVLRAFPDPKTHFPPFSRTDEELDVDVSFVMAKGLLLTTLVSVAQVLPCVQLEQALQPQWYASLASVALTVVTLPGEIALLFCVALYCAHCVGGLIDLHAKSGVVGAAFAPNRPLARRAAQLGEEGTFGPSRLLARSALELSDPVVRLRDINPFRSISRTNLLLLGLLYKLKIVLSNAVLKGLHRLVGLDVFFPAYLISFATEVFWNGVVLYKCTTEARLRLFGFVLAERIVADASKYVARLSQAGCEAVVRALGCSIVISQNYHSNQVLLFCSFFDQLRVDVARLDDWSLFLTSLEKTSPEERNFVLDLLVVAAAFDGRLSTLEAEMLWQVFSNEERAMYEPRLHLLTRYLRDGSLNAALELSSLDFTVG
jgi:hypothetical protein